MVKYNPFRFPYTRLSYNCRSLFCLLLFALFAPIYTNNSVFQTFSVKLWVNYWAYFLVFSYFLYLCIADWRLCIKENSQSVKRRHICFIRFLLKSLENFEYWKRWILGDMPSVVYCIFMAQPQLCLNISYTGWGYFVHSFSKVFPDTWVGGCRVMGVILFLYI